MDIQLAKNKITQSVATLLWKYGNTIENADNFKQVSNVKVDLNDNADARVLSDSFLQRSREVANIVGEFVSGAVTEDPTTHDITIPMTFSSNWGGQQDILKSFVEKYVIDGMTADWLSATAPNESTVYLLALKRDEEIIISEIYAVGGPI